MVKKLKIFCVTDKALPHLEDSTLFLAGVGKNKFNKNYFDCSIKNNIFHKEKYYSELTFHYWYWKNLIQSEDSDWVGFCQKRRFWIKSSSDKETINSQNLKSNLLSEPESAWENFDSILCNPINVSGAKKIKIFKRGWKNLLDDPKLIFKKNFETIKIHFDMHHGYRNLEKAIDLLENEEKKDFSNYVNKNKTYNPHIMFITKPEIANKWFKASFEWLSRCEEIFGFENLKGYDTTRLYAYLAERYLSFWFKKYTKSKNSPWIFINN
tara:strand:+ start:8773 stop:9573 length:801 start_codon:yes stop_codon:yes gene_type:complete